MTRNWIAYPLAVALWLPLLSCSTYHQPMETVVRDSLYITQRMIDRVLIRDSVFERQVHDTIYKYRERETVRYLSLTDTLYIERRDSISVPYPVEKNLTAWQSFRLSVGGYAIAACVILLAIFAIRLSKRFKR